MQVLALLPDDAMARIRASLPSAVAVRRVSAPDIETSNLARSSELIVLDPCELGTETFDRVMQALARASRRVLICTPHTELATRRVLDAVRTLAAETLMLGPEHDAALIRRLVVNSAELSVPARVLRAIARRLERLPSTVGSAAVGLFAWLRVPDSVEEFLDPLSVPVRTAHDWFWRAGLRSANHIRLGARVARVWPDLSDRRVPIAVVAERLAFGSVGALEYDVRHLTGLPPRLAGRLEAHEFAQRLVAGMTLSAGPEGEK